MRLSWAGETGINLWAIPLDQLPERDSGLAETRRDRDIALPAARGWRQTASMGGCPRG